MIAVTLGVIYNRDTARYSATLLTADSQPALKVEAHEDYLKVEPLTLAAIEPDKVWSCGRFRQMANRFPSG